MKLISIFILLGCFLAAQSSEDNDYKIVCYYNSFARDFAREGSFTIEDIDPFLCTHIVYSYGSVDECNELVLPLEDHHNEETEKNDLRRFARLCQKNPKLKCLLAIGGYTNEGFYFTYMTSDDARKDFVYSVLRFLDTYNFHGVSIDWYYPGTRTGGGDKRVFQLIIEDLAKEFEKYPEKKIIGFVGSGDPHRFELGYDLKNLARYADFISLMTFDYAGPTWSNNKTALSSPLYGNVDYINQNSSVYAWLTADHDVDVEDEEEYNEYKKKLLLGMPTFGRTYTLKDPNSHFIGAQTVGEGRPGPFTKVFGQISYNEILYWIKYRTQWTEHWDPVGLVPYAHRQDFWVSFENETSFAYKAAYIKKQGLGGAMISSLDMDDFKGVKTGQRYSLISQVSKILRGYVPENNINFTCQVSDQLFMNFKDCSKFYQCQHVAEDHYLYHEMTCPPDLYFTSKTCRCEKKADAQDCLNAELWVTPNTGCKEH